jgi:membrane protease YdiL (CAAX protease family)
LVVWFYPVALALAFLAYGLSEETGWRGFALPRLQRLHGPLVGSLLLGPLWGLWHLPVFWWPGWRNPPTFLNIILYVLMMTAFTIVITWVFNNTKGSVFMAMLLHGSNNAFWLGPLSLQFPVPIVTDSNVPAAVAYGAAALVIVALTRGQLGYDHCLQEAEEEPAPATTPT